MTPARRDPSARSGWGAVDTSRLVGERLSPPFCKGNGSLTLSASHVLLALERGHLTGGNVGAT